MIPRSMKEGDFIPATRAISIGGGVVYRPVRSWHSGVYAGEYRMLNRETREDKSGDIIGEFRGLPVCMPPKSYTHRIYWNPDRPERTISAFLSYPNGLSYLDSYHWEAMVRPNDPERFDSEEECEAAIRAALSESKANG